MCQRQSFGPTNKARYGGSIEYPVFFSWRVRVPGGCSSVAPISNAIVRRTSGAIFDRACDVPSTTRLCSDVNIRTQYMLRNLTVHHQAKHFSPFQT